MKTADPLETVLASQAGSDAIDRQIALLQARIKESAAPSRLLERLGWLYIEKARLTHDPGYYKLAELCAQAIESAGAASLLLGGHARQSLHKFAEAEATARQLIHLQPSAPAFGLLGDVLLDVGKLDEASSAYGQMAAQSPSLSSFSRLAQVRWFRGDTTGAFELMEKAAAAGSARDPEALAWVLAKLGSWQLQAGQVEVAQLQASKALALMPDYPPARLLEGRLLLAKGRAEAAIEPLQLAVAATQLPEYQWTLIEALEQAGRAEEAREVETRLIATGAMTDPRTFALFLATKARDPAQAVRLAQEEIGNRHDVMTYDVLAWALFANGETDRAAEAIRFALAEGTRDPRLFLHAALIGTAAKDPAANRWLAQAQELSLALLPSENARLATILAVPNRVVANLQKQKTDRKQQ